MVVLAPVQITSFVVLAVKVGIASTSIVLVAVVIQPNAPVPVTV